MGSDTILDRSLLNNFQQYTNKTTDDFFNTIYKESINKDMSKENDIEVQESNVKHITNVSKK